MLDLDVYAQSALHLADFARRYIETRRGEIKSHRAVELTLQRMADQLPDVPLAQLRRNDVAQYVVGRRNDGAANGTINCELLTLSAAINYVRNRWDWQIANPVPGQYVKWPTGRLRYLEKSEVHSLVAIAANVDRRGAHVLPDFLMLAVNTGMRKNEILDLTWDRVSTVDSCIMLTASDTKNAKPRTIPMNNEASAAVASRRRYRQRYCKGSRFVFAERSGLRVKSVYASFVEAREKAGIEDLRIHDLRHTFASWLVMKGVSLYVVRDLLGHSSIKMTERYAHLAQSALRQAVAVLDD